MVHHELNDESVALLNELADLQHPHLKGDNHTPYCNRCSL
jgi:hypothetical protein